MAAPRPKAPPRQQRRAIPWKIAGGRELLGLYPPGYRLRHIAEFVRDVREFIRRGGTIDRLYPILKDKFTAAGISKRDYFHQDLLVASLVFRANPRRHIDVGSRVDGFVAHVASFREIEVLDIRPLDDIGHEQVKFVQADLMDQQSVERSGLRADSVSCLHAIEHFGLGRYGDPLDPDGHLRGFESLGLVLEPGGTLYISMPTGVPCVSFNAERVFAVGDVLRWSDDYSLVRFDFVDDSGRLHTEARLEAAAGLKRGVGIYTLRKKLR